LNFHRCERKGPKISNFDVKSYRFDLRIQRQNPLFALMILTNIPIRVASDPPFTMSVTIGAGAERKESKVVYRTVTAE
jgi:hypothetical protein